MARRGKAGEAGRGKAWPGKAWQGKAGAAWRGEARRGKARPGLARQARHGKAGKAWRGMAGRGVAYLGFKGKDAKQMKQNDKLLMGVQEISDHLRISKATFYDLIKIGLPAIVVKKRWYAHSENLDNFFQKITRARMNKIPEDAE